MDKGIKKFEKIAKKANKIAEERRKIEKDIKDVAIKAIESKNAKTIFMVADSFAGDLGEEMVAKLAEAIAETGDAKYIYQFASIQGAPVDKLAKALTSTKNVFYMTEFAAKIEGAPVDKFAKAVVKNGTGRAIYNFALIVPNAPIDKLAEAILEKGNALDKEDFAYNILQTSTENFYKKYGKAISDDEIELQ